jgi:hypothetical protein
MDVKLSSVELPKWSGVKTSSGTPETQLNFDFGTDSGGAAGSIVGRRIVVGFGAATLVRIGATKTTALTIAGTNVLTGAGTDYPVFQVVAGKDFEIELPYGVAEKYKGLSLKLSVASVVVSVAVFD